MSALLRLKTTAIRRIQWNLHRINTFASLTPDIDGKTEILKLEEVERVLRDVHADDVRVIPVSHKCDWTDYMVLATGRSTWHVRNIAQALIHKAKKKQEGSQRMLLPSVDGEESASWIVVDSGTIMIHALDEHARAYYDLEGHWTKETRIVDSTPELETAMVKVRPKNNSKRKRDICQMHLTATEDLCGKEAERVAKLSYDAILEHRKHVEYNGEGIDQQTRVLLLPRI